jgi:hypothetical protein
MALFGRLLCWLGEHDYPEQWEPDYDQRNRTRVLGFHGAPGTVTRLRYTRREWQCRRCGRWQQELGIGVSPAAAQEEAAV